VTEEREVGGVEGGGGREKERSEVRGEGGMVKGGAGVFSEKGGGGRGRGGGGL